jgi:CRISPR/Cas system CSM-associated protein Csm2 small subunit
MKDNESKAEKKLREMRYQNERDAVTRELTFKLLRNLFEKESDEKKPTEREIVLDTLNQVFNYGYHKGRQDQYYEDSEEIYKTRLETVEKSRHMLLRGRRV